MELRQLSDRDQNNAVELAIKKASDLVEYKSKVIRLPSRLNVLFVCGNFACKNTSDKLIYLNDVIEGNVAKRINCPECGKVMNRKHIGVDITNVLKKYIKDIDEDKNSLEFWLKG